MVKTAVRIPGLHYSLDTKPGVTRKKKGSSFVFLSKDGRPIKQKDKISWYNSLRIPPAWTDVWISSDPKSHLQATGKDARGRKQYTYHPRWREIRDKNKFHHIMDFAKSLPKIRKKIQQDLKKPGLGKEKVLAAVVRLLEVSLIRVGNDEYAKSNKSYGLTTMLDRHAKIKGKHITFTFLGKSKVEHAITLHDNVLAKIAKKCRDIPGQALFQYLDDDGKSHRLTSSDVNKYIHDVCGEEFTAKDFRTWAGTVLAAIALKEYKKFDSEAEAKKNVTRAIESVASQLGNTPSICRKCYIHPAILHSYLKGGLLETMKNLAETTLKHSLKNLSPQEAVVLSFLQRTLKATTNT